jgi:hypothetical protein
MRQTLSEIQREKSVGSLDAAIGRTRLVGNAPGCTNRLELIAAGHGLQIEARFYLSLHQSGLTA